MAAAGSSETDSPRIDSAAPSPLLPALEAVGKARAARAPDGAAASLCVSTHDSGEHLAGSTGPPPSDNVLVLSRLRPLSGAPKAPPHPRTRPQASVLADRLLRRHRAVQAPARPAGRPGATTRCAPGCVKGARCQPARADAVTGAQTCPSSEVQLTGPEPPAQRTTSHGHPRAARGWLHTSPEKLGHTGSAHRAKRMSMSHQSRMGTAWGERESRNQTAGWAAVTQTTWAGQVSVGGAWRGWGWGEVIWGGGRCPGRPGVTLGPGMPSPEEAGSWWATVGTVLQFGCFSLREETRCGFECEDRSQESPGPEASPMGLWPGHDAWPDSACAGFPPVLGDLGHKVDVLRRPERDRQHLGDRGGLGGGQPSPDPMPPSRRLSDSLPLGPRGGLRFSPRD